MYKIIIQHLCTLLRASHPKSSFLPLPCIFDLLYPLCPPPYLSPLVSTILLSIPMSSEYLFLWPVVPLI